MKALTFQDIRNVAVTTVAEPRIEDPTDAIIAVQLAGVCGSDLHPYHGRESGLDCGTPMGHEAVGKVIEIGKQVTQLKVGDLVYTPFTSNCGRCFYCQSGLTCRCTAGQLFGWRSQNVGLPGLQAERARIPLADSTLVRVPSDISAREALLAGDVMATGFFAADLAGSQDGGVYAVVGAGPVGLMAILGARDNGATKIFVLDRNPDRLSLAEAFGAIPVNITREDSVSVLRNATSGRGADGVMECVGSVAAGKSAFDVVRPGGTIATVGVHTAEFPFGPANAYDKNLTYRTGRCPARAYAKRLLPILQKKLYPVERVITHTSQLDNGPAAYRMFDQQEDGCIKVVLTMPNQS